MYNFSENKYKNIANYIIIKINIKRKGYIVMKINILGYNIFQKAVHQEVILI